MESLASDSIADPLEWFPKFAKSGLLALNSVTAENIIGCELFYLRFLGKRKQFDHPFIFTVIVV